MPISRRKLLTGSLAAAGAVVARQAAAQAGAAHAGNAPAAGAPSAPPPAPRSRAASRLPAHASRVTVPNGRVAAYRERNGAKVFHLVAEPCRHEILPGLVIEAWGYNGSTPGPVIEVNQGDKVQIYVSNRLPEATTIHWHGIRLPQGMDGVAGISQPAIEPGETYRYEFVFRDAGTFMYHPHADEMTQIALGMVGMIVVHPRKPVSVARDYVLMTHEWKIPIGARRPDPMAMSDFNVLTFNSKAFPATEPLVAQLGERVRLRFGNLGPMDHHPIHLHGHVFELVATDGGVVPPSARHPDTTVLVPVGSTRTVELLADALGDWPLHCHMTHHMMNQMGHAMTPIIGADVAGLDAQLGELVPRTMVMGQTGMGNMMEMQQPDNAVSMVGGLGPFGRIDMGGMFTLLKVRASITDAAQARASWYAQPKGTSALKVSASDLAAAVGSDES